MSATSNSPKISANAHGNKHVATSLDDPIVKLRRISRASTLMEAGFLKYSGQNRMSFLTLTSAAPTTKEELSRHCRELFRRLDIKPEYVKIRTEEGFGVLHILLVTRYIAQSRISRLWISIHGASIVDIRRVKMTKRLKNYLTPYLQKQAVRLSSSRNFIYQGWRLEYRSIAKRAFFHWMPCLIRSPICYFAYVKALYYYYKQDFILNSLIPLLP